MLTRKETKNKLLELNTKPYSFDAFLKFVNEVMESPTEDEILGFVDGTQELAPKFNPNIDLGKTIDLAGTGGDKVKTINVGTITGLVLASAGLYVAKQSTRGYTGVSGSRDLLSHLGFEVNMSEEVSETIEKMIENTHFAAYYYPAFTNNFSNQKKFFLELKERQMKIITPNHLAAWLYNPIPIENRIYGMFTDKYLQIAAKVLREQGVKRAWVVNGVDGLDEISNIGETKVVELKNGQFKEFVLTPEDFGIKSANAKAITIKSAEESFLIADRVIAGEENSPFNDLILINAAAGLYLTGIVNNLKEGVKLADETLRSGKVKSKVAQIIAQ